MLEKFNLRFLNVRIERKEGSKESTAYEHSAPRGQPGITAELRISIRVLGRAPAPEGGLTHAAAIRRCARCQEDANDQKVLRAPSQRDTSSAGNPSPPPTPAVASWSQTSHCALPVSNRAIESIHPSQIQGNIQNMTYLSQGLQMGVSDPEPQPAGAESRVTPPAGPAAVSPSPGPGRSHSPSEGRRTGLWWEQRPRLSCSSCLCPRLPIRRRGSPQSRNFQT